jgi:hypothetical protein
MLTFLFALILVSVVTTQARAQQAKVEVVPAYYPVPNVGLTFNVNVTIQDVENLSGYEFKLYYPNDVLNGTSVTEGPFLKTGGASTFFLKANFTDNYNDTNGIVNILCLRMPPAGPMNGNGTLVMITFKATSPSGPRTLHLADVKLSDPDSAPIPFTTTDGQVTVIPEFPVALLLPLLATLTLVALVLRKKIRSHRAFFHSV